MTVMHIALFKWRPEVSEEEIVAFETHLATMPNVVDCMRSFRFGRDLGQRDGNFDYGVVAELVSADMIHTYLDHPAHRRLVTEHVAPILLERKAVQFELPE